MKTLIVKNEVLQQTSDEKVMLTVLSEIKGPITSDYLEKCAIVELFSTR